MTANNSRNSVWWSINALFLTITVGALILTGLSFAQDAIYLKLGEDMQLRLNDKNIHIEELAAALKKYGSAQTTVLVETSTDTKSAAVSKVSKQLLDAGMTKISVKNRESGEFLPAELSADLSPMPISSTNYKYFEKDGKWGYADENGNVIISPTYDGAYPTFVRGLANVKLNDKWGMIDTLGNVVVPIQYEELGQLEDERISFNQNGKYGFLDSSGEIIIPAQYDAVHFFFNGLAPVQTDGKWGFINPNGDMVIQPRFENIQGYMEDLAPVQQNSKWGFVDANDNLVIPCEYEQVNPFMSGLASVKINGTWGYINKSNEIVIQPQYENADFFYDSRATVQKGNKYGIIDKSGNMIVQPKYDMIANYNGGVCFAVIFEKPDEGIAAQQVTFDLAGNALSGDSRTGSMK